MSNNQEWISVKQWADILGVTTRRARALISKVPDKFVLKLPGVTNPYMIHRKTPDPRQWVPGIDGKKMEGGNS